MTTDRAPFEETPAPNGAVELHSLHHAAHPAPARVSGRLRRRLVIGLLVLLGLGGAIAGAGMLTGFLPNPVVAGDPKATGLIEPRDHPQQTVKVVRPKLESNFRITTLLPVAKVEPFYQAGLRPRVSGDVLSVTKDIGESVRAGELLVEIDVPDLKQAVEQKQAIILQREKELAVARADLVIAQKTLDAAAVAIKVKGVDVKRARDIVAARKIDLESVTILHKQGAVLKDKVDAAQLDFNAAERAVDAAEVDVEKAKVEEAGKAASLEKAVADVELKTALVEVAKKDRDAAAIQYGYSRLYAPFDGVIIARSTDPGKFVFGGASGASEPLITVGRIDLVTVAAKVPDNAAPFVSYNTEALVEFAQLPGVSVRGLITRFSRVVDPAGVGPRAARPGGGRFGRGGRPDPEQGRPQGLARGGRPDARLGAEWPLSSDRRGNDGDHAARPGGIYRHVPAPLQRCVWPGGAVLHPGG
jgi:multidrug resistance efflux pump